MSTRRRKHEGTLADDDRGCTTIVLRVIGDQPDYRPYLWIGKTGNGPMIATVTHPRSLRSLAHHILRALGDE